MAAKTIDILLSGGAANTDPNLSLGGAVSATELFGTTPVFDVGGISGVTLVDTLGGALTGAIGELSYNNGSGELSFTKTDGGVPINNADFVNVSVNGDYIITCTEGDVAIGVTVVSASLPVAVTNDTISRTRINPNLFANSTELEATNGSSKYRHFYLKNTSAIPINIKVYFVTNISGLDTMSIGFKNTTSGIIDELLADEDTAPAGVLFNSPTTLSGAIQLVIAPAGMVGMFLKREITILSDVQLNAAVASLVLAEV